MCEKIEDRFPIGTKVIVNSKKGCHYKRTGKVVGYSKSNQYIKIYFKSTGITTFYSPDSLEIIV